MILRNLSTRSITLRDTGNVVYTLPALSDLTVSDAKWSDNEFRRWVRYRIRDLAVATSSAGDAISTTPATTAQNVIQSSATNASELTLKSFAAQSVPVFAVQNSSALQVASIDSSGSQTLSGALNVGLSVAISGTQLGVSSTAVGTVSVLVRAFSGQTADLTQWQNSSSITIAAVTAAGRLVFQGDTNLYRNGVAQLKSDHNFQAIDGVATKTKAGTPTDADFTTTPPTGTIVVDTTANKIWVRTAAATWKGVTVA